MNNKERIEALYNVLASYAPNEQSRDACLSLKHIGGLSDDYIVRGLISAIYDGLAYGNWPWVIAKLNKAK